MKTNKAGLDLIKSFEGKRLDAYECSAGIWTIGYGHTSAAGAPEVKAGLKITDAEADAILARDLTKYEAAVDKAVAAPLSSNQFAALVSLCYNIGPGNFAGSTVVRRLNASDVKGAADAFLMWNKAGGREMAGLTRRRQAERKLFLS